MLHIFTVFAILWSSWAFDVPVRYALDLSPSTLHLRSLLPRGMVVVGIGKDKKRITAARQEHANDSNVLFFQCDADAMPFASETFDLIHMRFPMMEITPSLPDEFHRILKRDGHICVTEYDKNHPYVQELRGVEYHLRQRHDLIWYPDLAHRLLRHRFTRVRRSVCSREHLVYSMYTR